LLRLGSLVTTDDTGPDSMNDALDAHPPATDIDTGAQPEIPAPMPDTVPVPEPAPQRPPDPSVPPPTPPRPSEAPPEIQDPVPAESPAPVREPPAMPTPIASQSTLGVALSSASLN
jgi:hypothetical protein